MKTKMTLSRRLLLQGSAAVAGGLAANSLMTGGGLLSRTAFGAVTPEKPALLLIFLNGGYNALFSSADSFASAGTFGVTGSNVKDLGNGLVIDAPTFGTMPAFAQQHMAAIGIKHGISSHDAAKNADWSDGSRSYALMLADAMGGDAAIKCALVGGGNINGAKPAENGISMQTISDMKTTIAALGGANDPTMPDRGIAANGLIASQKMSGDRIAQSPMMLTSIREGYVTGVETLQKPVQQFNYGAMAQAYGMQATQTAVNSFTSKMAAAELMITSGSNVVIADDGGWDTHGDRDGSNVRNMMSSRILPGLNTFLSRMMNVPDRNVVVAIFGDFSRSLPGSDHQSNLTATVMGKYVKVGTTGRVAANVSLPAGCPNVPGFWGYLSDATKTFNNPFGGNPHGLIL